jgi:DNA-directed RNA polymerase specialized sigma24 family protein
VGKNTAALMEGVKTLLYDQAFCVGCCLPIFLLALLSEIPPDELFARCAAAASDPAPWREFFRRYQKEMGTTVIRITSGRYTYLYDDAMQDCYKRLIDRDCRALKAYNGGQDESKAQAYLRKIAASAAYRAIDREKPNRTAPPPPPDSPPSQALQTHPYDSILRLALEQCLHMVLHGRNKYRNMLIFKLVVLDGFKPEEITVMLGHRISSAHVVEMVVSRTRPKLRRCLSK